MKYKNYYAVVTVSIIVVALLVLAGPASAIKLAISDFTSSNSSISFIGEANVAASSQAVSNIALLLDGSPICLFDKDGNIISGCIGADISIIFNEKGFEKENGYGYGYGYGSGGIGKLKYNITFYPSEMDLSAGNHTLQLAILNKGNRLFESDEYSFTIWDENSSTLFPIEEKQNPGQDKGNKNGWEKNGKSG